MNTQIEPKDTAGATVKATFEVADPVQALAELAHITLNLRHYTKRFDTHFGYDNRLRKRHWEARADQWMSKHIVNDKTETDEN